jgi:aconitate decarboxylase
MIRDAPVQSLTLGFTNLLGAWRVNDPDLRAQCRLLLLDGLAVAVAGAAEPGPRLMADLARRDGEGGPARVIGHRFGTTVVQAARVNGMAMHVLDFEPMWNPPNHALSPLLPAVLALAERLELEGAAAQGDAVLRAIALGVEAQGRLRLASGQIEPAKLTLHPPGVVGPLAAALACGAMLGLSGERLAAAVSIAASRSAGLLANVGSMTKALHCGDGAAHGVEAAQMAQMGFTANDDALGSSRGWGRSLFGAGFDPAPLLAPIATARALSPGPAWKLFPSQFATHFAITAALEAREQAPGADWARDIAQVEMRVPPMPYIDRPCPTSGLDGKFSWQYTAAIALLDGRVTPVSFTDTRRFAADASDLLQRIVLIPDDAISGRFDAMHVDITLTLANGAVIEQRCSAPLGSWSRPVDASLVEAKADGLLLATLGQARTAAIRQMLAGVDSFRVCDLMALV